MLTCPTCKTELLPASMNGMPVFFCYPCQKEVAVTEPISGKVSLEVVKQSAYKNNSSVCVTTGQGKAYSKYRNVKTEIDGITFDSKREAEVYKTLRLRESAGEITDLQMQVPFSLQGKGGTHICKYYADFCYWENGVFIVVDAKTKITSTTAYRLKKKLLFDNHQLEIKEM